jgi:hypothetical protein
VRIRSTKPEFWRSKTIAQFDWGVRLVLKGLESYVDDNGVGKDDLALIGADVFPRDLSGNPPETLRKLREAISELDSAGLIVRYTIHGEDLLYIDRWKDIQYVQKPKAGRFPRPDGTFEYDQIVDPDSYRNPPEVVRNVPEAVQPGTGEQGNRGTGEISSVALVEGGSGGDPKKAVATKNGSNARGTRLPDGWMPDPGVVAQMRSDHPQVDLKAEHAKFVDYWGDQPGAKGRKLDWTGTWRNWIRRAAENNPARAPTPNAPPSKLRGIAELAKEVREAEDAQLQTANPPKELK